MAIAFDAAASSTLYNNSATSHTVSLTIGSGSDRMLAGFASFEKSGGETADSATSVTYNGTNLTFTAESDNTVLDHSEVWYLGEASLPSAGAYNLVVTWPTRKRSNQISGILMTGVKDQAPEASGVNNNTSDVSSGSVNITTVTANAWITGVIEQGTANTLSFDTALQRATASDLTAVVQVGSELITSAGATSLDWSSTGSKRWSGAVMAFEQAGVAAAGIEIFRRRIEASR